MFPYSPLIRKASNVKGGVNPPFSVADFQAVYPHFFGDALTGRIPDEVLDMFLQFANASTKYRRYRKSWKLAMCLFVAHFLTLYLQSAVAPDSPEATVIQAGQTKGLTASKSVDGVSVSYDFSTALSDLDGWAAWKLTGYGTQLATLAKAYGMGGMYVW